MGPLSIVGIMGLFHTFSHFSFFTILAPKIDHVSFQAVDIQSGQLCGLICPSPVIGLSRISGGVKLVTSQVVQRAWPNIHAYMRGYYSKG